MIEPEELRQRLLSAFPGAVVEINDLTGTKDHYEARVVSEAFVGVSPIKRHRLVYSALGDWVGGPIHALALKTETP